MTLIANIIAVSTLNTGARCKFRPDFSQDSQKLQSSSSAQLKSSFADFTFFPDTAMMLMPASFYSATAVVLSWIAGSLNQPAIKRASAIALINCLSNTPNGNSPILHSLFSTPSQHPPTRPSTNFWCSLDILPLLLRTSLPHCLPSQHGRSRTCDLLCYSHQVLLEASECKDG